MSITEKEKNENINFIEILFAIWSEKTRAKLFTAISSWKEISNTVIYLIFFPSIRELLTSFEMIVNMVSASSCTSGRVRK